jgi:hypothetical protein
MAGLSDTKVRGAKGTGKPYKLSDGQQLYLYVSASGGRSWRMNYHFGRNAQGKPAQKTLTIGPIRRSRSRLRARRAMWPRKCWPMVLSQSRRICSAGANLPRIPGPRSRRAAREWFDLQVRRWSKVHAADVLASLEADVFPAIGGRAIADITAPDVFALLKVVADRGAIERAHRLRQRISAIFVYGIALSMVAVDPAQWLLRSRPSPGPNRSPR